MVMERGEQVYGVVRMTRPVVMAAARAVGLQWGAHGVTVAMRAVLETIERNGPMSVPHLARVLDITRQAAQQTIGDLLDTGLVEGQLNPAHRRSPLHDLTPPARELFTALHAAELDAMSSMARGFSPAELDVARRVLEVLHADIRARSTELGRLGGGL